MDMMNSLLKLKTTSPKLFFQIQILLTHQIIHRDLSQLLVRIKSLFQHLSQQLLNQLSLLLPQVPHLLSQLKLQ